MVPCSLFLEAVSDNVHMAVDFRDRLADLERMAALRTKTLWAREITRFQGNGEPYCDRFMKYPSKRIVVDAILQNVMATWAIEPKKVV